MTKGGKETPPTISHPSRSRFYHRFEDYQAILWGIVGARWHNAYAARCILMARTRCIAARFRKARVLVTVLPSSFYDNVYVTRLSYKPRPAAVWSPRVMMVVVSFSHKSINFVKHRRPSYTDATRHETPRGRWFPWNYANCVPPETRASRPTLTRHAVVSMRHSSMLNFRRRCYRRSRAIP